MTTADPALAASPDLATNADQSSRPNLLMRNDTLLGVCEGLGQDLGINPLWLRLAFAVAFYFAPVTDVAVYLGLGLLLAAVRHFVPDQRAAPSAPTLSISPPAKKTDDQQIDVRLAA